MLRLRDDEQVRKFSGPDGTDLMIPSERLRWIGRDHCHQQFVELDLGIFALVVRFTRGAESWNQISISTKQSWVTQRDVSDFQLIEKVARAARAPIRP